MDRINHAGEVAMTAGNGVLLTTADVEQWRGEKRQLETEILERQQKLADITRKLERAEFFMGGAGPVQQQQEQPVQAPEEHNEEGDSAADKLCADMLRTGASLKPRQIKARLIELGFGEKIEKRSDYVYGLVYRLTKRGRLIRRGSKYRAAPLASSKEETGAVGAPVGNLTH